MIWKRNKTDETSARILAIIFEYALDKFDNSKDLHAAGMTKFLSVINGFVTADKPIDMCLPAFPFKSANKADKVLGSLPDKAEELALQRLNAICLRIRDIYSPGARITIISDGLVYNDLLCIPDRDTWAYGEALRAIAVKQSFNRINFSCLKELLEFPLSERMSEIVYIANATNLRRYLLNKYGKEDLDINYEIATQPDTLMTYCGYRRFLESDLQHIFPTGKNRSHNSYKRDIKYLAREMMIRGYAFAGAIKAAFPNHLRLSIHHSTGEHKVSLSLLHTETGYTTPWHCCVALMANGEWLSAPISTFKDDPYFDVIFEDGRPSYFREKLYRDEDRK
ncbi:Pyoverdine/dityrosine biosynthesis protein-domain-containing protein [Colletotrichum acutatum]|uniref:Pyoverdine/dityrosine biosynthesis protein-domain-containing protein n=1 Tax=Glomerella acutata TaxID=27357 RepID=A0AAD8U7K9_GLOAC|nr:Pyoverdine/dityrosine biosynthesis protein-domain-containing protein [Colletotrichum acutatum]KAK1704899.1 Pyoverdine/dityrosine biosynthesis protein-domain-containing protein [Colletotrichum acutatum]